MMQSFWNEEWKEINFIEPKPKLHYAISSSGRIASFTDDIKNARILKPRYANDFVVFNYRAKNVRKYFNVHRIVAEYFLPKPKLPINELYVIHLDYNHSNNFYQNLKWVNKEEMIIHQKSSPRVKAVNELRKGKGLKLTESQVRIIKKKIFDPKRTTRLKMIARQFGISEMQLYRIKSGENWGHVKI